MRQRCDRAKSWWHGKFRGCGYKITVGREAILQVLSDEGSHMSAEEISARVRSSAPSVGLTSVYRTLEIMVEMGLVHKCDFGDGRARYELVEGERGENHHHHLVCTKCNRAIEYTDFIDKEVRLLRETEKELSQKYRFRITNHLIQFYGVCEQCEGKTKG